MSSPAPDEFKPVNIFSTVFAMDWPWRPSLTQSVYDIPLGTICDEHMTPVTSVRLEAGPFSASLRRGSLFLAYWRAMKKNRVLFDLGTLYN